MLKKRLSLMLSGALLVGAMGGAGAIPAAAANPADAFSAWDLNGFTPKTVGGESVLVGNGGTFSQMTTKAAVSTAYLGFDVWVDSVQSTVDGNVGATYTTVEDHQIFFEYNTVSKIARVRRFVNGGDQHIGAAKSVELKNKTWYRFTIALEENDIRWYIGDDLIFSINNSYGEKLQGGSWTVQGYNTVPHIKNVTMYNSLSGAFPEWNTEGWERSTEEGQYVLSGGSTLTTKEPVSLNALELSVNLTNLGNTSALSVAYETDGGIAYSVDYDHGNKTLTLYRTAGGKKTAEKSASFTLSSDKAADLRIVLNDGEARVLADGKAVLVSEDTHGDVLATGHWTVTVKDAQATLSGLTFDNVAPDNLTPVKNCDLEFGSETAVKVFSASTGKVNYSDGKLVYTVSGAGSYLDSPTIEAPVGTPYSAKLAVKNTILFRMKNDTDTDTFKIYYRTDRVLRYSEENCVIVTVKKGSGFESVFANLSACKDTAGYLRGFRIVPVGATKGTVTIDAISFEREKPLYDYAGEILSCAADGDKDTVTVKGTLAPAYKNATVKLYELAINNWSESVEGMTPSATATASGTDFTVTLPFRNGKITRLTSLFMATVVTAEGEVKISDRFMVENYRDFSENPYAFTLPELTVKVTDPQFGAKGDGFTNDNAAIQAAIDYVNAQGGGTVVLEGDDSLYGRRYVASRVQMKDNVELRIEEGAVLWQSPREADYDYDVLRGHDMPVPGVNWTHIFLCHNYPLILASECKNVRVTGGGTIRMNDAGGENLDGYDGSTIWTGCECRIHIVPMAFFRCNGVEVSDITVLRANSYLMSLTGSHNVYVGNVIEKETTCASGDGIGLGAGAKHVLIDRFAICSNDDAVTLCPTYDDPRGMTWWHSSPGEDNRVMDVTVKSSYIFSGHGITFIPWGTDAPDLSKQEIRDIEVYDCLLSGPTAVGTWPDNPYYGKQPFDNTEKDDFSPVVGVRIHDNVYHAPTTLECITATDIITDCGIVSHNQFVHGDFERKNGKEGWVAGLSNWSYTVGEDATVEAVDVSGDHKGKISGTGSLYQGLHLTAGTHTFRIDTDLTAGAGILFVRDAISGEYLVRLPLRWGDKKGNEVTFALTSTADLELGVELTESGEILIDNASVKSKGEEGTTAYPDSFTENFEFLNTPTFDHSGGAVVEEDGNNVLKVENPNGTPKGLVIHEKQKSFDLRFHLKVTDVSSAVDGNVGVIFSRTDGDNCYFLEYNTVLKYIQLRSFVNGAPAVLFNIPKELKTGEWHQIGLRMKDAKIEVYLNGEKLAEAEAKANLRGTVVQYSSYFTGYCVDNITLAPAGELDMTAVLPLKTETAKGYTLTLNAGGGAPVIKPVVLSEGDSIPAFETPALEGYELLGWTMNGETVDLTAFRMPAHDVTLTAVWGLLPSETRPPEAETTPEPETAPAEPDTAPTEPDTTVEPEDTVEPDTRPAETVPAESEGTVSSDPAEPTVPADTASTDTEAPAKGGCKSAVGLVALILPILAAGAMIRKKKNDE